MQLVENEVARFLRAETPKVLCLAGEWGVGKTHLWRNIVKAVVPHSSVSRYSYVSLFGLNSLAEVKQAIFENSLPRSEINNVPSMRTLQSFVDSAEGFGRKASWFANGIAKTYVGDLSPAFFLTIRNQLVCFDDLERHGADLKVGDVLGLASYLREERNCRVAILLNDEKLGGAKDEFDRYLEKVSDTFVRLSRAPQEAADIALGAETPSSRMLATNSVKLGITNIRTLRRTLQFIRRVEPLLTPYDDRILAQAVQTLTLLCWSVLEPESAPSIEFLLHRRHNYSFSGVPAADVPEAEAGWNALLDAYGPFSHLDSLDQALLQGVQSGFFNPAEIEKHAAENNELLMEGGLQEAWRDAWFQFGSSFNSTEEQVLSHLKSAFYKALPILSAMDASSIIRLLKEFGKPEEAAQILTDYLRSVEHKEYRFFSFSEHHFLTEAPDADLEAAFGDIYRAKRPPRALEDALSVIGRGTGWNSEDEEVLWHASEADIYDLLKSKEGSEFTSVLSGATHWWRVSNPSEEMSSFNSRVRGALTRIAGENRLNAKRLERFGIKPPQHRLA